MDVRVVLGSVLRVLRSQAPARCVLLLLALAVLASCASARPRQISRVALLAPFEGRYREIGYNALYAARLALHDFGGSHIELLAVDDGGTARTALDRARALAGDPLVKAVVVLGYAGTETDVLRAFGRVPVLVVGSWGAKAETDHVFVLAPSDAADRVTVGARVEITDAAQAAAPLIGGDVFALEQFARLRPSLDGIRVLSSGSPPDAAFTERYQEMGPYTPKPGLLATLTYDAFGLVLAALQSAAGDVRGAAAGTVYAGLNGMIRFQDGYWSGAPARLYEYEQARLVPVNAHGGATP